MKFSREDVQKASEYMQKFGGGFMQSLGKALEVADVENTEKILTAWEEDVKRYLAISKNKL